MEGPFGGIRRAPTIADVARRAGVSNGAVSYAMHDLPGVSDETRARIRLAAAELGWEPAGDVGALMRHRVRAVGLVLAATHLLDGNDYLAPFVTGLEQALAAADHALLLRTASADPFAQVRAYQRMWQQQLDGVLVLDVHRDDPRLEYLATTEMPAVVVGRPTDVAGSPLTVDCDHAAGVRHAVRHLVGLGHRRIAFVGGPPTLLWVANQRAAWRSALAGAGLRPGPVAHDDATDTGGERATTAVLREHPTAIVYSGDLMAIAGLGTLRAAGVRVPADVSVVGFDDVRLAGYLSPPLTTVRVNYIDLGTAAGRLLLAALAEHQPPPTSTKGVATARFPGPVPISGAGPTIAVELVIRGTTTTAPGS